MAATPITYLIPRAGETVERELEVKRSRFIARVTRVQSEEEAREFIASARATYPDARHHCSAYIFRVDGAQPVERSSDDGEPSGTAGRPMLDVLKGSGLCDVAATVTRYFGGTKLGTGGLVSAYSSAVAGALEQVAAVTRRRRELATVSLPHADAGRIAADLRVAGVHIVDIEYGARALHTLAFDPGARTRVDAHLAASSHGTAALDPPADGGPRYTWVEEPTG